jgi:hypothetical protein
MRIFLLCVLWLSLCLSVVAKTKHYSSSNTLLTPSHESLLRQNLCADQMNLQRFQNEDEVQDAVRRGVLIALPETLGLHVAPSLPLSRRYARPTTVQFLLTLSEAYRLRFGKYLTIDSAVRSQELQAKLIKHNKSAAPVNESVHCTGAAVDLSKNLSRSQFQWLRNMLSYYQVMNVAVVEEERRCMHVVIIGESE